MHSVIRWFSRPSFLLLLGILLLTLYQLAVDPKVYMSSETERLLENTIYMTLETGEVVIELYPDVAPVHVDRIKKLVRAGFYDGASWHRVIGGVLAQCCESTSPVGQIDASPMKAELSDLPHIKGTVSMARDEDIDSAIDQFFITVSDAGYLDGKYTVFGYVREGIELIENLKRGDRTNHDLVAEPDVVISMRVAIDEETERASSSQGWRFMRLGRHFAADGQDEERS